MLKFFKLVARPANVPTLARPSLICTESSADFAS